jgi:RecA/RadA recombinase
MEKPVEKSSKKEVKKSGFDINKIVKQAQEVYGKKEAGLAKQLTTGVSLARPNEDKDYVVWTGGPHWKAITGLKGIPMGRIVQVSGKPDSGKSTHAMCFMKYAQDQGVLVILWDTEKKFSPKRFDEKMGGRSDELVIVDTNNIINGVKAIAHLVNVAKAQNPDGKILIVWDSVGASVNSSEDNEENEDYSRAPGTTAREVSYAIRKLNKLANKHFNRETGEETIATLAVNQSYASIGNGVSTQIEKGGSELYYLSSLVVQLTRKQDITKIKNGNKIKTGIVSRFKAKKNHLFDGDECISEMDIIVGADGIRLAKDLKQSEEEVSPTWGEEEEDE